MGYFLVMFGAACAATPRERARLMKIASFLVLAAALSVSIVTAAAAEVRDHRTPSTTNCSGGVMVNGQCTQKVKPPRCQHKYCHYPHPHR